MSNSLGVVYRRIIRAADSCAKCEQTTRLRALEDICGRTLGRAAMREATDVTEERLHELANELRGIANLVSHFMKENPHG